MLNWDLEVARRLQEIIYVQCPFLSIFEKILIICEQSLFSDLYLYNTNNAKNWIVSKSGIFSLVSLTINKNYNLAVEKMIM